jgi:hypothetical protein
MTSIPSQSRPFAALPVIRRGSVAPAILPDAALTDRWRAVKLLSGRDVVSPPQWVTLENKHTLEAGGAFGPFGHFGQREVVSYQVGSVVQIPLPHMVNEYDSPDHDRSYHRLLVSDYCGAASKRAERRHCRRFWRNGKSDGLWATRCGHGSVPSNHLVRHYLYGNFDHAIRRSFAPRRTKVGASRTQPCPNQITAREAGCATHLAATEVIVRRSSSRRPKTSNTGHP